MKKTYINAARQTLLGLIKTKEYDYKTAFKLLDTVKAFDKIKAEEVLPEWEAIQEKNRYIREGIENELKDYPEDGKEELVKFLHENHEGMQELEEAWATVLDSEISSELPVVVLDKTPTMTSTIEYKEGEITYTLNNFPAMFDLLVKEKVIVIVKLKKSKK